MLPQLCAAPHTSLSKSLLEMVGLALFEIDRKDICS